MMILVHNRFEHLKRTTWREGSAVLCKHWIGCKPESIKSSCANAGCCWPSAARSPWIFKWHYVTTSSPHMKDYIMLA